jgi:hypothetical protein
MSRTLARALSVALAAPMIHGIRAVKDDLHPATATAAACQGLHPQADFTGI